MEYLNFSTFNNNKEVFMERIEEERLKPYRAAFNEVWENRSKGHPNHSTESTVEGPLKVADLILDSYLKGL